MRLTTVSVALGIALVTTGCGVRQSPHTGLPPTGPTILPEVEPPPSQEPPAPRYTDWTLEDPFGEEAAEFKGISEAQEAVSSFTIYEPKGLGEPRVYVAVDRPPDGEAVALLYETEAYGILWVGETLPSVADDEERTQSWQEAATLGKPTYGTLDIATIRGGTIALL